MSTIPNKPWIDGYTAERRADSTSIIDLVNSVYAHSPSQMEVLGDTEEVALTALSRYSDAQRYYKATR